MGMDRHRWSSVLGPETPPHCKRGELAIDQAHTDEPLKISLFVHLLSGQPFRFMTLWQMEGYLDSLQ
jgi:hypothetical protein